MKFGFALSFFIVFIGGPLIFNKAEELKKETLINEKLTILSLKYFNANNDSYMKIEGKLLGKKEFRRIYMMSENKSYLRLINPCSRYSVTSGVKDWQGKEGK